MSAIFGASENEIIDDMADFATYKRRLSAHRWVIGAVCLFLAYLAFSGALNGAVALLGAALVIMASILTPIQSRMARTIVEAAPIDPDAQNAALHNALNGLPDPVALLGDGGTVQFANSAFLRLFGPIETGSSIMLRFRNPDLQNILRAVESGEQPDAVEFGVSGPEELWFSVTASRTSETQIMVHFRDLSETKRTERVRSDFIANASHELRTPLASLSGFIETLAGPARDDAAARDRFLKIMQDQAERMSRLIDDLLTLSRFETARGRSDFEPVNLETALAHVVDAMRPTAKATDTALTITVSKDMDGAPMVHGNRDELIQLFENLIENAIKYGKANGTVDVTVTPAADASQISVEVRDDGPGIQEQHLPRLVERFYRVDADNSRGKQGTGLGLSIVKHIVQRHGGRLKINSMPGSGSSFIVLLPKSQQR